MASRKRGSSKKKSSGPDLSALQEGQVWGSALILVGVLTLLALVSPRQGVVTGWWIDQLRVLVGGGVIVVPFLLIGFGGWGVLRAMNRVDDLPWYRPVGGLLLFLVVLAILHMSEAAPRGEALALAMDGQGGGLVGFGLSELLIGLVTWPFRWVAVFALGIFSLFLLIGPLIIATGSLVLLWVLQRRDDVEIRRGRAVEGPPGMPAGSPPLPSGEPSLWESWMDRLRALAGRPREAEPEGPTLIIGGNGVVSDGDEGGGKPARVIGAAASDQAAGQGQNSSPAPGSAETLIPRIIGGSRSWRLPNIADILEDAAEVEISRDEIRERARIIEQTLADFGVPVRVVEANQGPAVTQYGLQPGYRQRRRSNDEMRREAEELLKQRGYGDRRPPSEDQIKEVMQNEVERYERVKIKVSKIQALSNDLALALAASPIRIEAPVPGRPLVGLEVPNMQKALVSLRGVLESETFRQANSPLKIALGQDTAGQSAVADLGRMPHLLIAGATGSGKSVAVNAIIATLLLTHTPDTLRLLMVDPKMVELTSYNGIPHLLAPVVVELDRVVPLLRWATGEMDRRYKLFAKEGARNLEAFNAKMVKTGEPILPYMVLVIDELADLMMAAPDDVERYVCRLAQMSRATGIHLIIATQRPSVDVVTGLIKANFPSRIAFAVTSQIDSRVILDTPGAETLLGRGDMLFMRPDSSKLARLQGCFVSDVELERLVRYWKGVRLSEDMAREAEVLPMPGSTPIMSAPAPENVVQAPLWEELIEQQRQAEQEDDLYEDAVEVVRQAGRASVSLLQRRLRVGYSRAARLIDILEERGVVGPDQGGSRGREVLPESNQASAPGLPASGAGDGQDGDLPGLSDERPPRVWY